MGKTYISQYSKSLNTPHANSTYCVLHVAVCLKPGAAYNVLDLATGSGQRNQEKFRASETEHPAQKYASVTLKVAVAVVDMRSCVSVGTRR